MSLSPPGTPEEAPAEVSERRQAFWLPLTKKLWQPWKCDELASSELRLLFGAKFSRRVSTRRVANGCFAVFDGVLCAYGDFGSAMLAAVSRRVSAHATGGTMMMNDVSPDRGWVTNVNHGGDGAACVFKVWPACGVIYTKDIANAVLASSKTVVAGRNWYAELTTCNRAICTGCKKLFSSVKALQAHGNQPQARILNVYRPLQRGQALSRHNQNTLADTSHAGAARRQLLHAKLQRISAQQRNCVKAPPWPRQRQPILWPAAKPSQPPTASVTAVRNVLDHQTFASSALLPAKAKAAVPTWSAS